ncbi:hypothetical protein KIPB_014173, partial [Kipferlia bialata]|eukprot:g14173.t1
MTDTECEVPPEANPQRRSSLNVVNCLVGAGFLSLPYGYMTMGWIGALVFALVSFYVHRAACYQLI